MYSADKFISYINRPVQIVRRGYKAKIVKRVFIVVSIRASCLVELICFSGILR